jgi:hypothetical protein
MNNLFSRILKYAFYISLSLIICSFIVVTRVVEHRTNKALQDYSMLPNQVKVVDKVILGRSYPRFRYLSSEHMDYGINKLFRSGAIELVCTERGDILLVMKNFVHKYVAPERVDNASLFISFRVEDGIQKGEVEIQEVTFLSKEYFDTIASNPLSKSKITSIIKALEERNSDDIGFSIFDGGSAFYGHTKVSDVKKFVNRCHK